MSTHKALIRAWITVEFEDDGVSELQSQASDAFDQSTIDPIACDYRVMEVVPIKDTTHEQ